MRDLLLIACFAAVAVFGSWITKKADSFFAENVKSDDRDMID